GDVGPVAVHQPLAGHDEDAPQPAVHLADVGQEALGAEGDLRDVDQVRRLVLAAAGQPGGGRDPAGVAAHQLGGGDRVEGVHGLGVAAGLHDGRGQVLGHAAVARAVVGPHQVVVDGLGHPHHPQLVPLLPGQAVDLVGGVHRVVAADVEEVADVVG